MDVEYIKVAVFPKFYDVSPIVMHLKQHRVMHHLEVTDHGQELMVAQDQAERVTRFLVKLKDGEHEGISLASGSPALKNALNAWPATCVIILLGCLGYLITRVDPGVHVVRWLSYVDYDHLGAVIVPRDFYESVIASGQWWRAITPAFLHFGVLHIAFNAMGVWELGRRLEWYLGTVTYVLVFLAMVQISNFAQYLSSGPVMFGGLSGAVFGFVGLIGVLSYRTGKPILKLPVGLYVIVGVWLVAGFTGLVNKFLGIQMADMAHAGGLVCGALIGLILPVKAFGKK